SEGKLLPRYTVVDGFDAERVARHEQSAPAAVPQRKAEHAFEPAQEIIAPLLVAVNQHPAVATRTEAVAGGDELFAQHLEVVDLAIADGNDVAVLAGERLVTTGHIDDGQSTHAEQQGTVAERAGIIGSTMADGEPHAMQKLRRMTLLAG